MRRIAIVLAAVAIATPALSQTQAAMNATAAAEAKAADDALNTRYQSMMASLSSGSRLRLREAQRAWIRFRDLECRLETGKAQGGSAYPMVQSGCLARLTRERTLQLDRLSSCPEGDLACPR